MPNTTLSLILPRTFEKNASFEIILCSTIKKKHKVFTTIILLWQSFLKMSMIQLISTYHTCNISFLNS